MVTFLTIVFILVFINAAMMFSSMYNSNRNRNNVQNKTTKSTLSKIYPIELVTSNYKKAVQLVPLRNLFKTCLFLPHWKFIFQFVLIKKLFARHETIATCFFGWRLRQFTPLHYLQNFQQLFRAFLFRDFFGQYDRVPYHWTGIRTIL